jgi:serine/threonine protein kinase
MRVSCAEMPADARGSGSGPRLSGPAHSDPAASGIPAAGEIIAGKYEIEQLLGAGGMGVVVSARHVQLGQRVAIKFIRAEAAEDQLAISRFLREARATVALSSEHVTRVFDAGTLESGAAYMVMEHLAGVDLAETLRQGGALGVADAVGLVLQACEAIAEAHTKGIVHRDLKPSKLFVTRRMDGAPLVKVLDFGISKMASVDPSGMHQDLTGSGSVMGSPIYMSPEQVRSARDVDPRSDIWALGVILYELLAGQSPFAGETLGETFARILGEDAPPIRAVRHEVPPGLAAAIAQCLERDVARRFQSVGDLAVQLLPFAPAGAAVSVERIQRLEEGPPEPVVSSGSPQRDRAATPSKVTPHTVTKTAARETGAPWQSSAPGRRPSRVSRGGRGRAFGIVVVGLAAVGTAATGMVWRARRETTSASPPARPPATPTGAEPGTGDPSVTSLAPAPNEAPEPARLVEMPSPAGAVADGGPSRKPSATRIPSTPKPPAARSSASPPNPTATSNEKDIF